MKVLLIDVDSTIPNLALMKLSKYHKNNGDHVELLQLNIPYYPQYKKVVHEIDTINYDKIYASALFNDNHKYCKGDNIQFGGTAYDPMSKLSNNIESLEPDYDLYRENNITYDFVTRGCIRNCYFCFVPKKEGKLHLVKDIKTIIKRHIELGHKKLILMDNNILAYDDHQYVLKELIKQKVKVDFNQGLDVRLLNDDNQKLLNQLNYIGEYVFAFDDYKYLKLLEKKKHLLKRFGEWKVKLFVYVHPDMPLEDTIKRIQWCKDNKILPYIMRDISCWSSENNQFYVDLASYCNQPNIFKKMEFDYFLQKRHSKIERINRSYRLFYAN